MNQYEMIFHQLSNSKFRSQFHLTKKDMDYIDKKGIEVIRKHATELIQKRLAPAMIPNDGKQTPYHGHPVFIAEHATATCCRGCLYKWHHIKKGKKLTDEEIKYIVDIIMMWIHREMNRIG